MSKLTHSTGEGMDAIDLRRATEDGNEDLLPPMTDLERGPSSDGESAICATSLNKPSSQEGLKNCPFCGSEAMYDDGEHAVVCTNRIRCSIVGPTRFERSYAINQWNTRHPSFNDAIEAWQPIETAPKDGTWILIAEDHCWPPDLVRWQPKRPERMVYGTRYMEVPEGWFGSPGGRSRFDVPDGHLMKATRWRALSEPRSLKLPDYRGGDSEKTAESGNCPSTLNTRTE